MEGGRISQTYVLACSGIAQYSVGVCGCDKWISGLYIAEDGHCLGQFLLHCLDVPGFKGASLAVM